MRKNIKFDNVQHFILLKDERGLFLKLFDRGGDYIYTLDNFYWVNLHCSDKLDIDIIAEKNTGHKK